MESLKNGKCVLEKSLNFLFTKGYEPWVLLYQNPRLLGLGLKLYPIIKQHMLYKDLLIHAQSFLSMLKLSKGKKVFLAWCASTFHGKHWHCSSLFCVYGYKCLAIYFCLCLMWSAVPPYHLMVSIWYSRSLYLKHASWLSILSMTGPWPI